MAKIKIKHKLFPQRSKNRTQKIAKRLPIFNKGSLWRRDLSPIAVSSPNRNFLRKPRTISVIILIGILLCVSAIYVIDHYRLNNISIREGKEVLHGTATGVNITPSVEGIKKKMNDVSGKIEAIAKEQNWLVKRGKYQAVYLVDGTMYIGELEYTENPEYLALSDVYYLRYVSVTPLTDGTRREDAVLVKRGHELHGPVDIMYLNKKNILFYEDLREDSRILNGIKEYKSRSSQ